MTEDQARMILGVEPDASLQKIRAAHRRVMRSVHPDTNDSDEAHRLALLANQAREVLDRTKGIAATERSSRNPDYEYGEADYVEPDYGDSNYGEAAYEAAANDFHDPRLRGAARAYVPEATCAIIEHLEKTPGSTLTADEAGQVAVARLEQAGIGPRVRRMVFVTIAHIDFLQAGRDRGYWVLEGTTIRAQDYRERASEPSKTDDGYASAKETHTQLSTVCIGLGWLILGLNIWTLLFERSSASEDIPDVLMGLQMIVGASSYRSKKLRNLGFASDTAKRSFWELAGLLTAVFCGAGIAARDSGVGIFLTLWVIIAYGLAGSAGRRRRNLRNKQHT